MGPSPIITASDTIRPRVTSRFARLIFFVVDLQPAAGSGSRQGPAARPEDRQRERSDAGANLDVTRGLIVSEAVMMGLGPHIGRHMAHDLV